MHTLAGNLNDNCNSTSRQQRRCQRHLLASRTKGISLRYRITPREI